MRFTKLKVGDTVVTNTLKCFKQLIKWTQINSDAGLYDSL